MTNQIPYPPAKALWPLVGAMNLLWSRLQRMQQLEHEHQQLRQAVSSYIRVVRKDGHASLPLSRTGTMLDQLILAAQSSRNHEARPGLSYSDAVRQTEFPNSE